MKNLKITNKVGLFDAGICIECGDKLDTNNQCKGCGVKFVITRNEPYGEEEVVALRYSL